MKPVGEQLSLFTSLLQSGSWRVEVRRHGGPWSIAQYGVSPDRAYELASELVLTSPRFGAVRVVDHHGRVVSERVRGGGAR